MNTSFSQPPSPLLANKDDDKNDKKKQKSKSFKGSFSPKLGKSKEPAQQSPQTLQSSKSNYLSPPGETPLNSTATSNKDLNSLAGFEATLNIQRLNLQSTHEINNSDYIELEAEVEKISYELDLLFRNWNKLSNLGRQQYQNYNDQLKGSVEFQILMNSFNSSVIVKELEQSLFKLNWLITSKSGFSEPNWQTNVFSLTPSTVDSFIGVNLLKTYYKYVKYDFVSYKLFTRQLQLIQICAILLNIIHRVLVFHKEAITLSSITNTFNGANSSGSAMGGVLNESGTNPSLLSLSFSSDKYRPISWSANHVTLYNVTSSKQNESTSVSQAVSRASSTRRAGDDNPRGNFLGKEDTIKQIKNDLFLKELNEFIALSTSRLNIQASMANRTGYFYIVNQSTGLVLQAVDFTNTLSLKEQIEQNQKRLQNSSLKNASKNQAPVPGSSSGIVSKGPRFYLTPKINSTPASSSTISSSLSNETANDEQLWYYYLINGCVANKLIRSGYCMAASSLNAKSPVCFWPNVKTTNCSWFFNSHDHTIVSGLSDDLVLDYILIDESPNQRYAVVIDTKVPNKASQKWTIEFC